MKTLDITKINEAFRNIAPRMAEFLDSEVVIKECNFAMQFFNKNSYLNSATAASKQQAVLNVAQIGLTLNPVLKLAYLVPRYNAGAVECFLEPSYQGLVKLITDTGSAKKVYCYPVCEGDIFEVSFGFNVDVKHTPKFSSKTITHFYAVSELHDGSKMVEVMTSEDVDNIRERSESYKSFKAGNAKSSPWVSDYSEMGRKTVIKRLCKYLPKTEQWERLATAIDLDNSDYPASEEQIGFVESLLLSANLDERETSRYYKEIESGLSISRAGELIEYLQDNQVDSITAGHNYGQREISAKVKAEIPAPENGELFSDNQTKTE